MVLRELRQFDTTIEKTLYTPTTFVYETLPYQRTVKQTHVNKLIKTLKGYLARGIQPFFAEPIVINRRSNSSFVVLDGYHRIEASKQFTTETEIPVKLKMEVYRNLSLDEEREIYDYYNVGKILTAMDLTRPRIENTPMLSRLVSQSPIPVMTYTNKQRKLTLVALLDAYRMSERNVIFKGGIADYIKDGLTMQDVDKIIEFGNWYVGIVGPYQNESGDVINALPFHKIHLAVVMYSFWTTRLRADLATRLRVFRFDATYKEHMGVSGYTGFRRLVAAFAERLNIHNRIIVPPITRRKAEVELE